MFIQGEGGTSGRGAWPHEPDCLDNSMLSRSKLPLLERLGTIVGDGGMVDSVETPFPWFKPLE